jgi:excisionase family DNA binding protein
MSQRTSIPKTSPAAQAANLGVAFSLDDRLRHGWLSIAEVCALKGISRSTLYADARAGRINFDKHGRRSLVRGPVAAAYLANILARM